jgi:dGTPase
LDDVLRETEARLAGTRPASAAAICALGRASVGFSPAMRDQLRALKQFLFDHLYRHPRVMASMGRAQEVVTELYRAFLADPALLPPDWATACRAGDAMAGQVVRDYIAGMTDRYALAEYNRVFRTEIVL